MQDAKNFILRDENLPFEEELLKDQYNVKLWIRYINHTRNNSTLKEQFILFERACKTIPSSYKLWKLYLDRQREEFKHLYHYLNEELTNRLNSTYQRALMSLHKMPRIWLDYLSFLTEQKKFKKLRETFDQALKALALTQHDRLWPFYLNFLKETTASVNLSSVYNVLYQRYLQFDPSKIEIFIEELIASNQFNQAAKNIIKVLNSSDELKLTRSKMDYFIDLCEIVIDHTIELDFNVEPILKAGMQILADKQGLLWTTLASFYIQKGLFDSAMDIFEQGLSQANNLKDFSIVYDSYTKFQTTLIENLNSSQINEIDFELKLAKLEDLIHKRPFLASDVLLRQNPNNVQEWIKRIDLYSDCENKILSFMQAVKSIDPKKAIGKLGHLYLKMAKIYSQELLDISLARNVFEQAINVQYKSVNELAQVYCEYVDFLGSDLKAVRNLFGQATNLKNSKNETLYKNLILWQHYIDFEELNGTVEQCKAVYDRVLDLKIATPQIIINYAVFLQEQNLLEESFKVYERGLDLFPYPIAFDLWNIYLTKFLTVLAGDKSKLERARDLFEQALKNCPSDSSKSIFLNYAKMEQDFGQPRHSLRIYQRAINHVDIKDKLELYQFYIQQTKNQFGLIASRPIYEQAIQELPAFDAKELALEFAQVELKLGEVDRCRSIYVYSSQFCDPKVVPSFWESWQQFETDYGNQDTFREMLRIKRSVQTMFANNLIADFVPAKESKVVAQTEESESVQAPRSVQSEEIDLE